MSVKITIICESEALSFLRNNGFLPVKIAVWRNGRRNGDDIPIGITQENWDEDGNALTNLFVEQGNFPWRSHFYVSLLGAQSISIEINDAQDNVSFIGRDPARFTFSFSN